MAVNINIPSQVKTYANLAAFPATGALKTIYIAEDTNKTYRWTGSIYTEISASAAMTWGAIGGTLSNQTDLQSALDAKVPTSRTLTINGVTQDLSADRTYTISTGITIGTTAIASGVVGRVLFEGAGNVVQESSSLSYDDATKSFSVIGNQNGVTSITASNNNTGSSALVTSTLLSDNAVGNLLLYGSGRVNNNANQYQTGASYIIDYQGPIGLNIASTFASGANSGIRFWTAAGTNNGVERMRIFSSTGNVGINTTTDAGFKLDVNGTARVQGNLTMSANSNVISPSNANAVGVFGGSAFNNGSYINAFGNNFTSSNGTQQGSIQIFMDRSTSEANGGTYQVGSHSAGSFFNYNQIVFKSGNTWIGNQSTATFPTDAGFRLDVNGTARVQGTGNNSASTVAFSVVNSVSNTNFSVRDDGILIVRNATAIRTNVSGSVYYADLGNIVVRNGDATSASTMSIGKASTADASSILDLVSTSRGFLPPRMTTTQRNAIASPAAGLMVYDTTLNVITYYNGTMWI